MVRHVKSELHLMVAVRPSHDHISGTANQDGGFSRNLFPLLPQSIQLVLIMSNWSVLFDSILFKYVQEYARTCGNVASHAQILKDCKNDIVNSSLHKDAAVELSPGLRSVSKFLLLTMELPHWQLIGHSKCFFILLGQGWPEGEKSCNGSLSLCRAVDPQRLWGCCTAIRCRRLLDWVESIPCSPVTFCQWDGPCWWWCSGQAEQKNIGGSHCCGSQMVQQPSKEQARGGGKSSCKLE